MVKYDGTSFKMTRKIEVLFEGMGEGEDTWMKSYSILVDCIYAALSVEVEVLWLSDNRSYPFTFGPI